MAVQPKKVNEADAEPGMAVQPKKVNEADAEPSSS